MTGNEIFSQVSPEKFFVFNGFLQALKRAV